MSNLNFDYVPLTFISDQEEIKKQIHNTLILIHLFEKYNTPVRLEKLIEGTQYGYNASALQSGKSKFLRISDIHESKVNEDFGRVKFQKLLHLTEYFCKIDMDSDYVQKVAGPHAEKLLSEIESTLKRYRFYSINKKSVGNHAKVNYKALASASELDVLSKEKFKEEEPRIDNFLNKFRNSTWEQCEIIST